MDQKGGQIAQKLSMGGVANNVENDGSISLILRLRKATGLIRNKT